MSKIMFEGIKGPGEAASLDGSPLRVAIVHTVGVLNLLHHFVEGARKKLLEGGVREANIVIQSVPGSWELPVACQRVPFDQQRNCDDRVEGTCTSGEEELPGMGLSCDRDCRVNLRKTVLNEEQAKKRAGLTVDGYNHGEDGATAVEMGIKKKLWADGITG